MRTGCNGRPQSSSSGAGRSRNCVSTVPTEPAAIFDAGVAMRAIISSVSPQWSWPMYDAGLRLSLLSHRKGLTMAMTSVNSGVNVQALLDAREVLKGAPEAAKFTWRASCKWQNGTYSKTDVQGFFGLGQEQQHKTETSFDA